MRKDGYRDIWVGRDKGSSGYKLEHRLIMEKHIGRPLMPHEAVHHIDENKLNNNIKNLLLITKSEHAKIHNPKGKSIHRAWTSKEKKSVSRMMKDFWANKDIREEIIRRQRLGKQKKKMALQKERAIHGGVCRVCHEQKTPEEMVTSNDRPGGFAMICRKCSALQRRPRRG